MTIRPGAGWGRQVPRPDGLVAVDGDHELVVALTSPASTPIAARTGDLARTLGVSGDDRRALLNEVPIDLLSVTLGDERRPLTACAHVVARSPRRRGSWWRGPILAVMNAEFIGGWDVAPRSHPNDGRAESFEVHPAMPVRQRLAARRRLRTGTHVPHPLIATRSIREATWTFADPLDVVVDGRLVGLATTISVEVLPDAAIVHA